MITKRCLCVYKSGDRKFHLQTTINPAIPHNIYVRIDNADRYCPLASGTASNCINVRIGNADYHTVDYVPKFRFTYSVDYNARPYMNGYYFSYLKLEMLNNVTINNPVYLYLNIGAQTQSWVNVKTLPRTSVSTAQSYNSNDGYRFDGSGNKGYIKVGNWTSSTFWIANGGSHNVDITIPEAYWGV